MVKGYRQKKVEHPKPTPQEKRIYPTSIITPKELMDELCVDEFRMTESGPKKQVDFME